VTPVSDGKQLRHITRRKMNWNPKQPNDGGRSYYTRTVHASAEYDNNESSSTEICPISPRNAQLDGGNVASVGHWRSMKRVLSW